MDFVVTACPRSGTRYTAVLLTQMDVPCAHEAAFKPETTLLDAARWHGGESSWVAWAFLPMMPSVVVLHQRRDPWKVIDSLAHRNRIIRQDIPETAHRRKLRDIIMAFCPRVGRYESNVDRAAAMLLDWHARIEEALRGHPCLDYRVEDLADSGKVQELLATIGETRPVEKIEAAIAATDTNENLGRIVERNAKISNPDVERWIRERFPGMKPMVQRVSPATEFKSPDELAEMMDGKLLSEVRDYAAKHGY